MRPYLYLLLFMVAFLGRPTDCHAQIGGRQTVLFIMKDSKDDTPLRNATFTITCDEANRNDRRTTLTDTFKTVSYRPGTTLHCSIHCPGYKSKTEHFTVDLLPSKNVKEVYLDRFVPLTPSTVQIEGYVYYMREGKKEPVSGEQVTIGGISNPKVVLTDQFGEYRLSFDAEDLIDPKDSFSILAGRNSESFRLTTKPMAEVGSQQFEDIELIPFASKARITFRLYDPRTQENIPGASVQVFAEGKLVGEGITDDNGDVDIHPEIGPEITRVTISIQKEGFEGIEFRVFTADLNSPYVINDQIEKGFFRISGTHSLLINAGISEAAGVKGMLSLEVFRGIGRTSTMFLGVGLHAIAVTPEYFPKLVRDSLPIKTTMYAYPLSLTFKQYSRKPSIAKGTARLFWGWSFFLSTKGPNTESTIRIGEGALFGVNYLFTKNIGAEARVGVNNLSWNIRDRTRWEVVSSHSLYGQLSLNVSFTK